MYFVENIYCNDIYVNTNKFQRYWKEIMGYFYN